MTPLTIEVIDMIEHEVERQKLEFMSKATTATAIILAEKNYEAQKELIRLARVGLEHEESGWLDKIVEDMKNDT